MQVCMCLLGIRLYLIRFEYQVKGYFTPFSVMKGILSKYIRNVSLTQTQTCSLLSCISRCSLKTPAWKESYPSKQVNKCNGKNTQMLVVLRYLNHVNATPHMILCKDNYFILRLFSICHVCWELVVPKQVFENLWMVLLCPENRLVLMEN